MVLLRQGMQQVRNYYNLEAQMISSFPRAYNYSFSKPRSKAESKLEAAKKHSEAEKRRRTRINIQYNNLRYTLSNIIKEQKEHKERQNVSSSLACIGNETNLKKSDKASVLAETIKQVRKLLESLPEVEAPSWEDILTSEQCNHEEGLMKATLSCEDRPGLMLDIARALGSVKAKVVKAEMVTVGGRTRIVLWVKGLGAEKEGVRMLRRTLKVVMHKPVFKIRRFTQ